MQVDERLVGAWAEHVAHVRVEGLRERVERMQLDVLHVLAVDEEVEAALSPDHRVIMKFCRPSRIEPANELLQGRQTSGLLGRPANIVWSVVMISCRIRRRHVKARATVFEDVDLTVLRPAIWPVLVENTCAHRPPRRPCICCIWDPNACVVLAHYQQARRRLPALDRARSVVDSIAPKGCRRVRIRCASGAGRDTSRQVPVRLDAVLPVILRRDFQNARVAPRVRRTVELQLLVAHPAAFVLPNIRVRLTAWTILELVAPCRARELGAVWNNVRRRPSKTVRPR
jgi:hypothetical protein